MKYRLLALLLALLLSLAACSGGGDDFLEDDDEDVRIENRENDDEDDDGNTETEDPEETEDDVDMVTEVRFTYMIDEGEGMEYAVITAHYEDGTTAWEHVTDRYYVAQMYQVFDMELWQDRYYYIEGGKVVALDRQTGEILWENPDFGGCPADGAYLITQEGELLLTGYFGPDFIVIDRNGKTISRTESFDTDIFWPYSIEMAEDLVQIAFEGTPDGNGTYLVNIDPNTWEEFD